MTSWQAKIECIEHVRCIIRSYTKHVQFLSNKYNPNDYKLSIALVRYPVHSLDMTLDTYVCVKPGCTNCILSQFPIWCYERTCLVLYIAEVHDLHALRVPCTMGHLVLQRTCSVRQTPVHTKLYYARSKIVQRV